MHDHIKILFLIWISVSLVDKLGPNSLIVCVLIFKRQQRETFKAGISWLFQAKFYILHKSCTAVLESNSNWIKWLRVNSRSKGIRGSGLFFGKLLLKRNTHTEKNKNVNYSVWWNYTKSTHSPNFTINQMKK